MNPQFDIAVSFAGEDRDYVERFVNACKSLGINIFYDRDMIIKWWGKDFIREQRKIYGEQARYFMPFISTHYLAKPIPIDEYTAAIARSVELFGDYILPVKIGGTAIPHDLIQPNIGFINADNIAPEELAAMAYERVTASTLLPPAIAPAQYRKPVPIFTNFSPYKAGKEIFEFLDRNLTARVHDLEQGGYSVDRIERNGIIGFRVSVGGELAFALDMWQGTPFNDAGLGFLHGIGPGHTADKSSMTAQGTPIFDGSTGTVKLDIINFSLFGYGETSLKMSQDELLEAIWKTTVDTLDQSAKRLTIYA